MAASPHNVLRHVDQFSLSYLLRTPSPTFVVVFDTSPGFPIPKSSHISVDNIFPLRFVGYVPVNRYACTNRIIPFRKRERERQRETEDLCADRFGLIDVFEWRLKKRTEKSLFQKRNAGIYVLFAFSPVPCSSPQPQTTTTTPPTKINQPSGPVRTYRRLVTAAAQEKQEGHVVATA